MLGFIWIIAAFLLVALQFTVGVFDLIFPAMAALLTGLCTLLIPGLADAWALQVLVWTVSGFLSVFFLRKRLTRLFKGDEVKPGSDRLEHAGQKALVLEDIAPGRPGRVKFHGTSWKALSLDEVIPTGAWVYIMEKQGMNYLVSRKLLEEDETAMQEVESVVRDTGLLAPGAGTGPSGTEGDRRP